MTVHGSGDAILDIPHRNKQGIKPGIGRFQTAVSQY